MRKDIKTEKVVVDGEVLNKTTWLNGPIEEVRHYNNSSQLHGKREIFYIEGGVSSQAYYKEGRLHGAHSRFYKGGSVDHRFRYKEGLAHGKWEQYHTDSTVFMIYYFSEDLNITEEVVEFLEENPPINGLYPSYVEGYFKLKYGLSLEELDIKVSNS